MARKIRNEGDAAEWLVEALRLRDKEAISSVFYGCSNLFVSPIPESKSYVGKATLVVKDTDFVLHPGLLQFKGVKKKQLTQAFELCQDLIDGIDFRFDKKPLSVYSSGRFFIYNLFKGYDLPHG